MRTAIRALAISLATLLVASACGPAAGPGTGSATSAPAAAATATTPDVAAFYRGKTVSIVIGYDAGGGYDTYARTLSQFIGKHIPGTPTVIVENMPGAGSIKAANHLFRAAPKDGTVFGTFGRGLPYTELIGDSAAQFKSAQFNWIGSMNDEVSVCILRADSPIKTFEQLLTTPVKIGATGPDDDTGFFPRFLNGALGTKFELVTGYAGGNDVNLAIERGEVAGRCGFSWSSLVSTRPQWLKDKFVNILVQMSLAKHPEIPKEVPLIMDYAKNDEQRQMMEVIFSRQTMGRPFAAPPGVPAERVKALRDAFEKTMKDPEFKAAADKAKQEINPKGGEEIQKVIQKIFQTPKPLIDKIKAILG